MAELFQCIAPVTEATVREGLHANEWVMGFMLASLTLVLNRPIDRKYVKNFLRDLASRDTRKYFTNTVRPATAIPRCDAGTTLPNRLVAVPPLAGWVHAS